MDFIARLPYPKANHGHNGNGEKSKFQKYCHNFMQGDLRTLGNLFGVGYLKMSPLTNEPATWQWCIDRS
jgi:hypothetical protein